MQNSPRPTRGTAESNSSDKATDNASLESTPSTDPPPHAMGGTSNDSGKSSKISKADIETLITACISKGDVIDTIVNKLADKIVDAVAEKLKGAVDKALSAANEKINQLTNEVVYLKGELKKVETESRSHADDIEQYTRRNNIRVFGIPETIGEDTDILVTALFKDKLSIDIPVERLDRSHRVGRKPEPATDGSPRWRPIIVRFTSYRDRRSVFNAKKLLKGSGITIREDLTTRRMAVLRAAGERFGVRNTWTSDGRILWTNNGQRGVATCMEDLL